MAACGDQRIGREHARAAAIGQDRQFLADLLAGERQGFRGVEQFGHCRDAEHAGAAERGIVNGVGTRQNAGMGTSGPRAGI